MLFTSDKLKRNKKVFAVVLGEIGFQLYMLTWPVYVEDGGWISASLQLGVNYRVQYSLHSTMR